MPMLIQLDHILKKLKINLKLIIMIGISFIFLSCSQKDFKIVDTKSEISIISTYNLKATDSNLNKFDLFYEYPNLSLLVKLQDSSVAISSFNLYNPDSSLIWYLDTELITFENQEYIGSNDISLVSFYFEEGTYYYELLSKDGRALSQNLTIKNKVKNHNPLNIYLSNKYLIFSKSLLTSSNNIDSLNISNEFSKIKVSFYDKDKNYLSSNYFENKFKQESYPFKLKIDNFDEVYYVEIEVEDSNTIKNILKIDLSSAHSSL